MALIQREEMELVVGKTVNAVRAKAAQLGIKDGALAICYNNTPAFSEGSDEVAFDDLKAGEDRLRVFRLHADGSHIVRDEDGAELYQCFGIVAMKIAAAAKAYAKSHGRCILSSEGDEVDNIPGRVNWGGCVRFPIFINPDQHCANIYVSVSGGTDKEDELCAWAALKPIQQCLTYCYPRIPAKY
ncbi:hypothetical protein IJM16_04260 [Candidatus Saccharibacteria bacterium]|nr:hypothetical protein [Candidatus Saccharibacteria bacterium]